VLQILVIAYYVTTPLEKMHLIVLVLLGILKQETLLVQYATPNVLHVLDLQITVLLVHQHLISMRLLIVFVSMVIIKIQ